MTSSISADEAIPRMDLVPCPEGFSNAHSASCSRLLIVVLMHIKRQTSIMSSKRRDFMPLGLGPVDIERCLAGA